MSRSDLKGGFGGQNGVGMKSIMLVACLLGTGCWGMGCTAYPPKLHPDFDLLQPTTVRVTPVENRTRHTNLHAYPTAGFLQRALLDADEIDVLRLFHEGAAETLTKRGYGISLTQPAQADASDSTADLHIRLLDWVPTTGLAGGGIEVDLEVELVQRDSDVTLYKRRCRHRITGQEHSGRLALGSVMGRGIKRSVRGALYYLPAVK